MTGLSAEPALLGTDDVPFGKSVYDAVDIDAPSVRKQRYSVREDVRNFGVLAR